MQHKKANGDSKFSLSLSVSEGNLPSLHAFLQIMNSTEIKNMSRFYLFLESYALAGVLHNLIALLM